MNRTSRSLFQFPFLRHFIFQFLFLFLLIPTTLFSQTFYPLWPIGKKPNDNGKIVRDSLFNERIWQVATPGIYAFIVPQAENKGTSILICPGGGYERLSYIYNGFQTAKWLNAQGINAFVLIYRLPHQRDLITRETAPLMDAQRAIRLIRSRAREWRLLTDKLGIFGVSAGGHLAAMTATESIDRSAIQDSLDSFSFLPDFTILVSPVITMGRFAHAGSRKNFLGSDTSQAMIMRYSMENNVTTTTPPAFIIHAQNDSTVNVRNSILFASALVEHNIPVSLHIFPQGGHSLKIADNPGSSDMWPQLLRQWLIEKGFLNAKN